MMNEHLAQVLLDGRNSYSYPGAFLGATKTHPPDVQVGTLRGVFVPAGEQSKTSLLLDAYHHSMLAAANSPELLHMGIGSVIYWGYITSSHERARVRATRYLSGTTPIAIQSVVQKAITDVAAGDYGSAIGQFGGVREISRLPFASKVVAFLSPEGAGVYDNRINSFLADHKLSLCDSAFTPAPRSKGMMSAPSVSAGANQKRYQSWCTYLARLRDDLNALGDAFQWTATEEQRSSWRAIDVERAIFHMTKLPYSQQSGAVALLRDYCKSVAATK